MSSAACSSTSESFLGRGAADSSEEALAADFSLDAADFSLDAADFSLGAAAHGLGSSFSGTFLPGVRGDLTAVQEGCVSAGKEDALVWPCFSAGKATRVIITRAIELRY